MLVCRKGLGEGLDHVYGTSCRKLSARVVLVHWRSFSFASLPEGMIVFVNIIFSAAEVNNYNHSSLQRNLTAATEDEDIEVDS